MHAINRRKALTVVASVPAIATLAAMPAVASAGEDAELRKLWEKLKAERAECDRLLKVNTAAVDAAWDEYAPRWDFHDIELFPARRVHLPTARHAQGRATKGQNLRSQKGRGTKDRNGLQGRV